MGTILHGEHCAAGEPAFFIPHGRSVISQSLTTEQLAGRWQRRPQWIRQAAKQGRIPGAWKLGHLWRFRLAEIEAYEQAQQVPPGASGQTWELVGKGPDPDSIFALSPLALKRLENKRKRVTGSE